MFAKSPSSPDPLSPRLSHHRTATAGDQPRRPGSWQSIPVSARSATAPGTPASPMSPLSPRIGSKGLPMQPTPVTPDPLLASPGFTVDDWAHTQGVSPEELQALQLAGLDPAAPDTFEHWPLPDDTGRSVPGLPTAPRSGMAPPSGWTELSVRSASGSVQHYRFMPITVPRDLRRLRQGLLMAELASALGAPGVMPAVHACFHRVDGVLTYGMLLPFDPYAPSAADAGLNPQRPGLVSQCVALDWLGFLMGQRIEPDDLVWEPQGNGLQLRLKLPPETVLASGLNTGSGPGHPGVIERDMLTRLARTDPAHWGREASSVLGDSAGDGLRQRLEWARSLNDSMVQVIGPASQRESTGLLQQLGGDDIAELLEKVKAGKITVEAARQQARHESMAARIVLEHGLQVAAARRSDPQEITSPRGSGRQTKGKSRIKVPRLKRIDVKALRQSLKLDDGAPTSPRESRSARAPVSNDTLELNTLKVYNTLKPYEARLAQRHASKEALTEALTDARSLNLELVRQLDHARADAERDDQPLSAELDALRTSIKLGLGDIEGAARLWQSLTMHEAPWPAHGWSVQDLLDLVQAGLGGDAVAPALHCGAHAREILDAHRLALPPSWALVGRSVLEDAARAHASSAQVLREQQNWAQAARAAAEIKNKEPTSPRSPRARMVPASTAMPQAPQPFRQILLRNTSKLWIAGERMEQALATAKAYDEAMTRLKDPAAPLDAGCQAVQVASLALSEALARLASGFTPSESGPAAELMSELQAALAEQQKVLSRLPALAQAVRQRLPQGWTRSSLTSDLLTLTGNGGPDEDYMAHGFLAGWSAEDILAAHREGWPSWMMDLGHDLAEAHARRSQAAAGMKKLIASWRLSQ